MKKNTVTLEDLLRVKRAERPPAEFWTEFERELRAKQLAAIVEPRPWWASFIRVGSRLSHYHLPVGAAAILALSFVTVREYRTLDSHPMTLPEIPATLEAAAPFAHLGSANASAELVSPMPSAQQIDATYYEDEREVSDPSAVTGRVAHAVPLLDGPREEPEPTPSERAIAANLAAAQAADPGLMDEVFGASGRRVQSRDIIRDPLAQVSVPGENRRARILATSLPVPPGAGDVAVGSSDRVARYLTEERLYDSISRIGVQGDRVAIKF